MTVGHGTKKVLLLLNEILGLIVLPLAFHQKLTVFVYSASRPSDGERFSIFSSRR